MILVGRIGQAHGLKGLVKLQSFTSPPEAIAGYKALKLKDGKPVRLAVSQAGGALMARIEGFEDRTKAETLRDTELYVDRADLPQAGPDEYYHADLVGLSVRDHDDQVLGKVLAVHDFGAGVILEIKPEGKSSFMLPFNKAFVPVVDIEGGRLVAADYAISDAGGPEAGS